MSLFLTILEGATPGKARPILVIRDDAILATVRAMVHARLTEVPNETIMPPDTPQETPPKLPEMSCAAG